MAILRQLFFGILTLQICVNAAPSDVSKLDEIANVKAGNEKLDPIKEAEDNTSSIETVREKRFYDPFGFGFPPINPLVNPSFNKRDDYGNTGNFGIEDPLSEIHRRVQEIAGFVRPPQPPRIPPVPIFYPVLFVPPFDCNCNPNNYQPTDPPTDQPTDQSTDIPIGRPTETSTDQPGGQPNYTDTPDEDQTEKTSVTTRFSELEDERRNWGLFINKTGENSISNQGRPEFSRPISFDPIRFNQPTSKPAPPVEHGTLQSDVTANPPRSTPPPTTRPPPPSTARPTLRPINSARPSTTTAQNVGPPTACDAAIIACCHRPLVVYDCFAIQGCPNITSYGNPCETNSILRVIEKLQRYYSSRSG